MAFFFFSFSQCLIKMSAYEALTHASSSLLAIAARPVIEAEEGLGHLDRGRTGGEAFVEQRNRERERGTLCSSREIRVRNKMRKYVLFCYAIHIYVRISSSLFIAQFWPIQYYFVVPFYFVLPFYFALFFWAWTGIYSIDSEATQLCLVKRFGMFSRTLQS